MNTNLGFAHFWAQGDVVSHAIAVVLLLMSATSWSLIVGKLRDQWRLRRAIRQALPAYWQADGRHAALSALADRDASGVFVRVAQEAEQAAHAFARKPAGGLAGEVDAGEFLGRTLQQSLTHAQARVEHGLTLLASVGSTAPFIGLFGTVWGIYHALTGLSGAGQVALDQVAGPVGEALIMTAAGLFVAIPAVLAYNACARSNRLVLAQLDGFAHSLHAYLVAGIRPTAGTTPSGCTQATARVTVGG